MSIQQQKYKYVAYVRKSTEEAERQVMSIEAQIDQIKRQFPGLDITFIKDEEGNIGESMSAMKPNRRPLFLKMMSDIEDGKYHGIIAWHPDRLSRNAPEAARIVWDVQQGYIKDLRFCNFTFESTPEGIMTLQMIMSQAQYFSAKLSKDVRRGNAQKRRNGGTTTMAPIGYINNPETHYIEPDPERFDIVRKAFGLMLTGNYSIREIAEIMNNDWGFLSLKRGKLGGKPISKQTLSKMFKNKLYAGVITDPHTGEEFPAAHEAMITLDEYNRINEILSHAGKPSSTPNNKEFPLRGLIRCGECGCLITAETKTKHQKNGITCHYTYYHCTHRSSDHKCRQRGIREELLDAQVNSLLSQYEITPELYDWGLKAIQELSQKEAESRQHISDSQNKTISSLEHQLDVLLDKLVDGIIDDSTYQQKSKELRARLTLIKKARNEESTRAKNWFEVIGTVLHTLSTASNDFNNGNICQKRMILSTLGSNPTLTDGILHIDECFWLKPIKDNKDSIIREVEKVRTSPQQIKKDPFGASFKSWLGMRDSNPRMVGPEPTALPLGESPIGCNPL